MRADFSLDYDVLTVERPQKLYLIARFAAGETPSERARRPLNLSLVIDRSGSMAGDKIDYTRQAAQFLMQHLGKRDIVSIVLYNDKVETLLPPEQIVNKDSVSQLLERIRVRGTTNLSGGWLEGCQHVSANQSGQMLNRVIVMTDGLANRGVTDAPTLVSMAKQKYEKGISTTTMGLGRDFNEDLLMDMASSGGGAFYFIESPEVAPTIFQEELSGLLNVVGQNLSISIEPTQHVKHLRQLNAYPEASIPTATTFKLGDIFGNEVKTLVLELTIPAMDTIGEAQIATLRFEYDEIATDKTTHHTREFPVMVNVKPDGTPLPSPNAEVAESVLLLRAARARQNAVQAADKGDYGTASAVLKEVAEAIDDANLDNEQLREEQKALLEQSQRMARGASGYDDYSRKTMSTQAFYTMMNRHDDTVMLRSREKERSGEDDMKANEPKDPIATIETIIAQNDADKSDVEHLPGVTPTHVRWKGQDFTLKGNMIRIGRATHNEIIINERGVSRFHSQIRRDGEKLFIEDLGSTNGTLFNNIPLSGAKELSVGDVIYLCDEKLVFHKQDD